MPPERRSYTLPPLGAPRGGQGFLNDAAISSGGAFLVSELEKLDPRLREPLTSVTYPRDVEIITGGGWAEAESKMNVEYGVSGAQSDAVGGGAANAIRVMQANLSKDIYPVFPYEISLTVKFIDIQRSDLLGRSLEQLYDDGIRLDYDKYMDINTYRGQARYGTYGLVNDPAVTAAQVADGASGGTEWSGKTPDEILTDVNDAIVACWAAAEYDQEAIPNHVLIPPRQYADIVARKVSEAGNVSILTYLLDNNIAKQKGVSLFIGDCRFCAGAGTGATDRMVVYVQKKRFVSESVLVPLARVMTQPSARTATYDSLYVANVGTVIKHYLEPFRYADGI
jgi:hypothetical protein